VPEGLTSPAHMLVIILVALIVLGPEKVPHAMRQAGRAMGELRRWTDSISSEVQGAFSLEPGGDAPTAPAVPLRPGREHVAEALPVSVTPAEPTQLTTEGGHPALQEGGEWR
jgi:TatA/E family protein of Tat protein translocase